MSLDFCFLLHLQNEDGTSRGVVRTSRDTVSEVFGTVMHTRAEFRNFCESQPPQNSQYPRVVLVYSDYWDFPFSEDFQSLSIMPHEVLLSSAVSYYS